MWCRTMLALMQAHMNKESSVFVKDNWNSKEIEAVDGMDEIEATTLDDIYGDVQLSFDLGEE